MKQEIKKYDWVDALRGYAILMVMMIHTSQLFLGDSFHLNMITRLGDLGVTMFFIASSFTLFNSYKNRSIVDGKYAVYFFFVRRFFRIAPLYYLSGVFYIMIGIFYHSMWIQPPIDLIKIIANFTFLNGVYLPAINYIPLGGWSVGVEMLFYLTIPFLFSRIKNIHTSLKYIIISILFSFGIQLILYFTITNFTGDSWISLRGWYLYFWFPNQFPVFCFGIFLFFFIQIKIIYKEWMLAIALILFVLLSLVNFEITFPRFLIQREYLYSIVFCIFAFTISKTKFTFMVKPINKLGQVSFSAYLMHFIVIEIVWKLFKLLFKKSINNDINFIIVFVFVVILTFYLSKMTYKFERFGISIGELLIERKKNKRSKSKHHVSNTKVSRDGDNLVT
jgi:peptidoglycan/LPS O-acetylase OafA/YrhL